MFGYWGDSVMRSIAVLAVIVALLPGSALAAEEAEWAEFASPEDGFTINFPGQPVVETITYLSEYGAELPARVYRARDGAGRFSVTVVDYNPVERLLTEKAKACARGLERCLGNPAFGAGYWKTDVMGAVVYATWRLMQRDAKLTYYWHDFIQLVDGHLMQFKDSDGSQTHALVSMYETKVYIVEGTTPGNDPTALLFREGFQFANALRMNQSTQFYRQPLPPVLNPAEVGKVNAGETDAIYRMLHPGTEPIPAQ
jgi:hypothetical protein